MTREENFDIFLKNLFTTVYLRTVFSISQQQLLFVHVHFSVVCTKSKAMSQSFVFFMFSCYRAAPGKS